MVQPEELLTTLQVAQQQQVSVRTVMRMKDEGELAFAMKLPTKTGGFLFDESEVRRAFAARAARREAVPEQVPA